MGKSDYYSHRNHNVICDRCGFKKKRSQVRFTWDNLLVCADTCWEPRHPQDFVRSKIDKQSVADPRPDSQIPRLSTSLAYSSAKFSTILRLESISNISLYDSIGITLDSGVVQWSFVTDIEPDDLPGPGGELGLPGGEWGFVGGEWMPAPSQNVIVINDRLEDSVAVGNTILLTGGGDYFVALNEVSASDL